MDCLKFSVIYISYTVLELVPEVTFSIAGEEFWSLVSQNYENFRRQYVVDLQNNIAPNKAFTKCMDLAES